MYRPFHSVKAPEDIMEASIPQSGETGVSTDQVISLRFSKPLNVATVNATTVTLRAALEAMKVNVVPAENGMLAFITNVLDLGPNQCHGRVVVGDR
jgi:hypothetical protein